MNLTWNNQSIDASDVLRRLFGIDADRIGDDLALAKGNVFEFRRQERSIRKQSRISSNELVKSFHLRLLIASQMSESSRLPADLILFSSTQTAHEIAEMCCAVATGKGQLRQSAQVFEESGHENSIKDPLVVQSERLLARIHDTVVGEVLKRYHLTSYAHLFEENRPLYEIRFEVGRRLIVPDLVSREEHFEILEQYQEDYGSDIVREFLRRLEKHDLLPA